MSSISESFHLLYPDTAFRNLIAYKGNPNYFCILVLVIVTPMIDILLKGEFQYNKRNSKKCMCGRR